MKLLMLILMVLTGNVQLFCGTVVNTDGDGKLYCAEPYNYISYKYVDGVEVGDEVLTVNIMNPMNDEPDDILERYDFILGK